MTLRQAIKELRNLRDEAICYDDYTVSDPHCLCERYDRVIDMLESALTKIDAFLQRVADPKHSDGEGLAKIPQEIPDEYLSDGEMLDEAIELLNDLKLLRGLQYLMS